MQYLGLKVIAAALPVALTVGVTAAFVLSGRAEFGGFSNVAVLALVVLQGMVSVSIALGALSIGLLLPVLKTLLMFALVVAAGLAALSGFQEWAQLSLGAEAWSAVGLYQERLAALPGPEGLVRDAALAGGLVAGNLILRVVWSGA